MFNGKQARRQYIEEQKAKAQEAKKHVPVFMGFMNKPELPSQENRAIDNYRVNFYGNVVKRR